MKRIFTIILIGLGMIFFLIIAAKFLSDEDDWIYRDNIWIKHGNPSSPAPNKPYSSPKTQQVGIFSQVEVFFLNNALDPEITCRKAFPVKRKVVIKDSLKETVRLALEGLLKGPTEQEKSQGYFTNIPPGVKIQEFNIINGAVFVDFNEALENQVGGSCRVTAIRTQITKTITSLGLPEAVISINGRTEDILQP